ncbi:uncharacterized protein EAF01_006616 [Botrytis porri]|uniref:uncharacterized protein n=1 Tax=Botrytis porri TaxID=87229 RepID=UPI0018FFF352|nr:uncharacterized protein EAF01_006616 [Botrytis porri]KAF7903567.1 hypothetical protein EAF01_006616 [Botrytis porri]
MPQNSQQQYIKVHQPSRRFSKRPLRYPEDHHQFLPRQSQGSFMPKLLHGPIHLAVIDSGESLAFPRQSDETSDKWAIPGDVIC